MEPFTTLDGVAAPMRTPNIDTDQLVPARFLWRRRKDGWGQQLFHDLRYGDDGKPRTSFVLNTPAYEGARIIVAGRNFGCGSSREHAVWCLVDYGVRAVIAPSFGDIFFNNSFQNGLLPIVLPEVDVQTIMSSLETQPGSHIKVDLEAQTVACNGGEYAFAIDPFRKECLLAGADDIGFTQRLDSEIGAFERDYESRLPWI